MGCLHLKLVFTTQLYINADLAIFKGPQLLFSVQPNTCMPDVRLYLFVSFWEFSFVHLSFSWKSQLRLILWPRYKCMFHVWKKQIRTFYNLVEELLAHNTQPSTRNKLMLRKATNVKFADSNPHSGHSIQNINYLWVDYPHHVGASLHHIQHYSAHLRWSDIEPHCSWLSFDWLDMGEYSARKWNWDEKPQMPLI